MALSFEDVGRASGVQGGIMPDLGAKGIQVRRVTAVRRARRWRYSTDYCVLYLVGSHLCNYAGFLAALPEFTTTDTLPMLTQFERFR